MFLICLGVLSLAACGRSHRYNVETEVVVEVDGQPIRRVVVTQCRAHDVPTKYESSIIGNMDSASEIGEPVGIPLPDGRMAILGGVYGCWVPTAGRANPGEIDLLDSAEAASQGQRASPGPSTYIFDNDRRPSVIDVYDTWSLLKAGGPLTMVTAVRRTTDQAMTSDLGRIFPAVETFGAVEADDEDSRGTRFAGLHGKRWPAGSVAACSNFDPATDEWRVNCQSDDAEDIVLVHDDQEDKFVVLESPPRGGLKHKLYRVGGPDEPRSAPIDWRPDFCVEDLCTRLERSGSTKIFTPSGMVYEVRSHILDLPPPTSSSGRARRSSSGTSTA